MTHAREFPERPPPACPLPRGDRQLREVRKRIGVTAGCWSLAGRYGRRGEDEVAKPGADGVYAPTRSEQYRARCNCEQPSTCTHRLIWDSIRQRERERNALASWTNVGVSVATLTIEAPNVELNPAHAAGANLLRALFGVEFGGVVIVRQYLVAGTRQTAVHLFAPLIGVPRSGEGANIQVGAVLPLSMPDATTIGAAIPKRWTLTRTACVAYGHADELVPLLDAALSPPLIDAEADLRAAPQSCTREDLRWLVSHRRSGRRCVRPFGWMGPALLARVWASLGRARDVDVLKIEQLNARAAALDDVECLCANRLQPGANVGAIDRQIEWRLRQAAAVWADADALKLRTAAARAAAKDAHVFASEAQAASFVDGFAFIDEGDPMPTDGTYVLQANEEPLSYDDSYLLGTDGVAIGRRTGARRRPGPRVYLQPEAMTDERGHSLEPTEGEGAFTVAPWLRGNFVRWVVEPPTADSARKVPPLVRESIRLDEIWPTGTDRPIPVSVPPLTPEEESLLDPTTPRDPTTLWQIAQARYHLWALSPGGVDWQHMFEISTGGHGREYFGQDLRYAAVYAAEWGVRASSTGRAVFTTANLHAVRGSCKQDIAAATNITVDLDAGKVDVRGSLALLESIGLPPTLAVCSGTGVHPTLALRAPVTPAINVERTAARLIAAFHGGDHVHSSQHPFRLAGSINRKAGRAPLQAYLVGRWPTNSYTIAEIETRLDAAGIARLADDEPTSFETTTTLPWLPPCELDEVMRGVRESTRQLVQDGDAALQPGTLDRSGVHFGIVLDLIEARATCEQLHELHKGPLGTIHPDGGDVYLQKTIKAAFRVARSRALKQEDRS